GLFFVVGRKNLVRISHFDAGSCYSRSFPVLFVKSLGTALNSSDIAGIVGRRVYADALRNIGYRTATAVADRLCAVILGRKIIQSVSQILTSDSPIGVDSDGI